MTPEAKAGLSRFSSAIAVVFLNRRMLLDTVRQHTLLSDLLASMTEGVALLTPHGRIAERNNCFSRLIGGAPSEDETLFDRIKKNFSISRVKVNGSMEPVEDAANSWINGAHYRFESTAFKDGAPEKILSGTAVQIEMCSA